MYKLNVNFGVRSKFNYFLLEDKKNLHLAMQEHFPSFNVVVLALYV